MTALVGLLLVAGRMVLPLLPADSSGAFFVVPPTATVPQANTVEENETTAHTRRTHMTSGGVGRMHTGTANINRRRCRRRRDNPIADVAGERRRNNLTATI